MNGTVKAIFRALMETEGDYLFYDKDGDRFRFTTLRDLFIEAVKKSEIQDFRFHDCRHCFASNLIMAGEDLNTVRELLGHKKMEMTLRYAHLAPNPKRKAVDTLDRIMSQNPPQAEIPQKMVHLSR